MIEGGSYSAQERSKLARAVDRGESPQCPVCGGTVALEPVRPPPGVSYVRRRVLVRCPTCRRAAAVDVRADEPR